MNCKKEFIEHVEYRPVKCAEIVKDGRYSGLQNATDSMTYSYYRLSINYTFKEYEMFLELLDFEYDDGFGGQEIYGHIWYEDGTWSERRDYDGSEWWEYMSVPDIPEELKGALKNE
jgi:hypothetical protein